MRCLYDYAAEENHKGHNESHPFFSQVVKNKLLLFTSLHNSVKVLVTGARTVFVVCVMLPCRGVSKEIRID